MKTAAYEIKENGLVLGIQELTIDRAKQLERAGYRLRRIR